MEVAGLVLGIFPAIIASLKYFSNSALLIRDMSRYSLILDQYRREMEMEQTKFHDIYLQLLQDMSVNSETLEALISDPEAQGQLWKDAKVGKALEDRLVKVHSSTSNFVEPVKEMYEILEKFNHYFELQRNRMGTKFRMRPFKRRLALENLEQDIEDYCKNIRKLNADLSYLVYGGKPTILGSVSGRITTINDPRDNPLKYYERIQKHAVSLYNIIREGFEVQSCDCCGESHSESLKETKLFLQLEWRSPSLENYTVSSGTRSHLLIHRPTSGHGDDFRQLELEYLGSEEGSEPQIKTCHLADHSIAIGNKEILSMPMRTPSVSLIQAKKPRDVGTGRTKFRWLFKSSRAPTPSIPDRRSLQLTSAEAPQKLPTITPPQSSEQTCLRLAIDAPQDRKCLGILNVNTLKQDILRHRVWVSPLTPQPTEIQSLDTILRTPAPSLMKRLKLGVNLASAVMHLSGSGWLNDTWDEKGLLFLRAGDELVLEKPLVQAFQNLPELTPKDSSMPNPTLFRLGVILFKLWYWKPSLVPKAGEVGLGKRDYYDLVEDLMTNAGSIYGAAVRGCLDCAEVRLEQENFRNEVYKKILYPLEENLRNFSGVSHLADIF